MTDEDYIDSLVQAGDEDATLVADFEEAAAEALQEDPSLSSAYTAYQDARRRLAEKPGAVDFGRCPRTQHILAIPRGNRIFPKGLQRASTVFQEAVVDDHCRIES